MDRHTATQSQSSDDNPAFEQATRWHLRLRESTDPAIRGAYDAWLSSEPHHPAAMSEVERVWGAVRQPAIDLAQDLAHSATVPTIARARPDRRRRSYYAVALAASVLLVAGLSWLQFGGYDRLRSDAYTSVGEMRRLILEDGSIVTLNTDTALSFNLDASRREVKLLRGEAYFEVAHDPARPFVVDSSAGSARVLGTAFNIQLDRDQMRVSVVDGNVSVSSGDSSAVLAKGQSAWMRNGAIEPEADRNAVAVKAWQRGQIVFYRAPLSEVVAELGRYRHGVVMIRGEALRRMPVSGAFDVTDPDEGLRLMRETLGVRSLRLGGWITVIY